ncbi:choice-of-anchor L domain-containing protein [Flavobacterium sp.]|uniref:T9SS type B sorting domain-containing protein n=1 Tax=Flavobacterium sp. TaxID=239 RepID=UPI002487CCF6|nr:choice-of-anchor L domain-containing protein [Flavobacterium sp.]MDI1315903.1 choice-of-anchor L domain-containing protein [Flavobacterium sp.]
MKNIVLLTAILLSTLGFSQPVSVSSTNYTVPQLVNNVLINSPCVSATNITWRTGTNYGSSNGLGFFQNTNPNFPMQSGVVLSTGNILNTPGPNTSLLNDGVANWPGDNDLEATLAAAGISMISKNATVLEFDFTPISPNFSFDFIFASEEYGNFQCLYSDAFAFLLTNVNTGVTTNLAVVPNTTLPISVVTIRDFQYNSSCPSANAQYFGSFNGGSGAANSATNFNGQTKVLTASSILTAGVPYHIKLVIADRADPQSDSAIFLSSDSFNIGQDVLGQDLSAANNSALCFGTPLTLTTGLSATEYSFVWKKGTTTLSETGPNLTVSQAGTYTVTYINILGTCDPITDTIIVEYLPQINSPNPITLYKCDMGQASYTYNLDQNTSVVKQGLPAATSVTYFASQNNADNNTSPLPLLYSAPSGTMVYVRIQLPGSPCFTVKSFLLQVSPPPVANQAPNLLRCTNTSSQSTSYFNFTPQTSIVLGTQSPSIYAVTYYTSSTNATTGVNPIADPSYGAYGNTTIYVRVQNISDPSCFSVSSFNLIVNPLPIVDVLQNVIVCNTYTLQPLVNGNYFTAISGGGTPLSAGDVITETQTIYIFNQPGGPGTCGANSSFKVTIVNVDELTPADVSSCGSYSLPSLTYGKYYTQPGGPSGGGTEIPSGTSITSSQLVYFYFTTIIAPICVVDSSFNITIINTLDVGTFPDVFRCDSYVLPALNLGNYYSSPGGTGTQLAAGTPITSNQTIYVYAATTGPTVCSDEDSFDVFIGINQPADISQCNGYTLPSLPIGNYFTGPVGTGSLIPAGTVINVNSTIYIYVPLSGGGNNCTDNVHFTLTFAQPQVDILPNVSVCETFTLPTVTNGEYFSDVDGTGTQLYPGDVLLQTQTIYIFKRLDESCANQSSFTVTINPLPAIDSRSDIDICDQYVLTPLAVGTYYSGTNGTGTLIPANTVITTSQRIYIYAVSNTTPACTAENSFQINIFSTTADTSANITACDTYTLPTLSQNNNYFTQSGGPLGTGTEIAPGTVITTSQTVYIFKESTIRTSFSCIDETSFIITINQTPVLAPIANVVACNSYTLPTGNYYSAINGSGTLLNAGAVLTTSQTIYVFANTATAPDCISQRNFSVTIFNVDDLPNVTICENFTLPTLAIGKYYTGPNGTGTQLAVGSVISSSMTLYIYGQSPFLPRCSDESTFTVTIIDTPIAQAIPASLRTVCDEDGTNDGVTTFNLASLSATVLGTQTGTEFEVTYYESLANATTGTNPVITSTQNVVYVRVKNNLTSNCFDVKPITIIVNKLPEPTPIDGIICIDSETGNLLNPYTMYSGLTTATHHFVWTNESGTTVGTSNSYQAILPGIYTLIATSIATGCSSDPISVTVTPSEPAIVTYEVSEDFADSQSITVTATGQGNNFEYQLDNGPFQDSNVFNNVASGMHTVTVRDKNGCGSSTIQALVVNYPKYFTPNGDGYNDSWNIKDLSNQPSAKIEIFDRYGKMITLIKPNNSGWDGTYNGRQMPSDDYWFSVSYTDEHNTAQEFRAHFAMKR